jgi:hypothetical protein
MFIFLCRLKITHDSHEFILEFGTVANNYISQIPSDKIQEPLKNVFKTQLKLFLPFMSISCTIVAK